ncbi:suppressor of tumorigenicity protein 13 [Fistulifera solaris]|uniref:Suppressor of tumorigenicity protein 13 n=1 Tax=Fistulifera solaris TaxID=1519565 RepID=A0A1Z5JPR6_FISSO|nr:suppressor of tumorigenicity protein 13 [Fistulifera solaris]|eukprot:GAX15771.1 suppressor of tumorigenicity protein 13 [Fistulifera solaris]
MTPIAVTAALEKLGSSDRELVETYIQSLREKIQQLGGTDDDDVEMNDAATPMDEDLPPLYEPPAEDFEKAAEHKQNAADAKDAQNWDKAVEEYTAAIVAAPPSALVYANRAYCLLQLGRAKAAERDCDAALQENPDSAKALRMRGKARKELGLWEEALKDLSQAQTIDFDEGTVEDLKWLTEKHIEMEKKQAEDRIKEEEKLRKRAEEIKKAQEEAKEKSSTPRTMPGFPGGIPGVPGGMTGNMDFQSMLGGLMSDPELLAAMQNPKVMSAFQGLMTGGGMPDPAKMQELMSDPEVGPVMQKLMAKFGGMAGMGGGGNTGGYDDDGIPDIGEVDDLDDLPDLE